LRELTRKFLPAAHGAGIEGPELADPAVFFRWRENAGGDGGSPSPEITTLDYSHAHPRLGTTPGHRQTDNAGSNNDYIHRARFNGHAPSLCAQKLDIGNLRSLTNFNPPTAPRSNCLHAVKTATPAHLIDTTDHQENYEGDNSQKD
jgi:hypothetical protein